MDNNDFATYSESKVKLADRRLPASRITASSVLVLTAIGIVGHGGHCSPPAPQRYAACAESMAVRHPDHWERELDNQRSPRPMAFALLASTSTSTGTVSIAGFPR
jgi:hypothetical protein